MMPHHLHRTTHLAGDPAAIFEFFKDPRNLEELTPPWLSFRVVASTDDRVRQGTRIRYRLSLLGAPFTWESRITEYDEGTRFADEQLRGPYRRWYHRHGFTPVAGGVQMTDDVEYELPFGVLGRLVHWLVVRHQLRAIFDYRTTAIQRRFAATGVPR